MRIPIVALFLSLALATPAAAQTCMRANNDGESARGRLVTASFRDAAGRRESAYILQLPVPTCLTGSDEPQDNHENVRRIHVFSSNDRIRGRLNRFVGQSVRVRGNPFPAHTSHHHAPIVMDVSEIDSL